MPGLPRERRLDNPCILRPRPRIWHGSRALAHVRIGALQEYVEHEEDRVRREREECYRRNREEERIGWQQKFLSGADSGWTQIQEPEEFYNGWAFRTARGEDKRWKLYRITTLEDPGVQLETYQYRRDAKGAGADCLLAALAGC